MSSTDNYLFAKSLEAQGEEKYTPYTDLQWNYMPDSNNGVYQPSNCMVQFDLQNLYSASKYVDASQLYLAIPITMIVALSNNSAAIAPGTVALNALASIKSNYNNLIHSCDLVLDGKTINQSNAFTNVYTSVKMMSQLSPGDLETMGASLGFSSVIDNHRSMRYVPVVPATNENSPGTGLCNNIVFSTSATPSLERHGVVTSGGALSGRICNRAIQERIFRYPNITSVSENGIYGTAGIIQSELTVASDLRPYFKVQNNCGIFYDVALLPLKYLFDSLSNIGLTKKLSGVLKIYLNTGSIAVPVNAPTTKPGYSLTNLSTSTFVNTCPLTINYLGNDVALPATTTHIVAGLYVSNSIPSNSIAGVNLASVNAQHPLRNCRLYYPQIELDVNESAKFNEVMRNKKVVHRQFTVNTFTGIGTTGTENRLVQAGIKNPLSVIIVPYLAAVENQYVEQFRSPFDTFPNTLSPVQLSNLQVSVGGRNYLANQLNYSYDVFLQQINTHDNIGLSDIGVNQGLFDASFWELNRVYIVDVGRSSAAEKLTPRSVQVNFTNNTNVVINYMVFVEYLDDFTIDTLTGAITMNNQM